MKKILLIENDPNIMRINALALTMRNYSVFQAFCLKEASEFLSENVPDMIVMEANLPDGNGFDFCRKIKQESDIPIVFLCKQYESEDVVVGLRVGADDYITKPYDLEVLIARIEARLING